MQGQKRRKMVAGNWKMHGRQASNNDLLDGLATQLSKSSFASVDVVLIPPAIYLSQVASSAIVTAGLAVTAVQDVTAEQNDGAFTGDLSAAMAADIGAGYSLAGHSERRALHGESSELVAAKAAAAIKAGLVPVICVGETDEQRQAGDALTVIRAQLDATANLQGERIYAYEPVWAIGTGKTASPDQAQEVHAFIRDWMGQIDRGLAASTRVLYGGSVKAKNAQDLFSQRDIDGALVGGASLDAAEFGAIIAAAQQAAA